MSADGAASAPPVGRLAPSPTGALHLGNARTFLLAWLSVRSQGGRLLLRMEDLDHPKVKRDAARAALEDLRWLGLDWDEGPDCGGPSAPYVQSARRAHYAAALARLRAVDPEAAARILRHAIAIDPENPGLRLSLAALDGKVSLSKEERLRGVAVAEADPWLRDPSPDRAAAYERLYGPVLTAGFRAAGRLGALHLGDRASVLRQILAAYREAPETLGAQERIIALLHLPEAEAAASLLARDAPSTEELTFFLCAYPWTDAANALFAKHATRLAQNDCLGMLYLNHGRNTRRQQIDRVGSFFARDGHFAYAYFHLTHLLAEGKLDDALDFVSDFIVADRLADAPVLLESLRLRVIDRLLAQDPARALAFLREWLTADPAQPGLWECLLNLPEATEDEMRQCLARYPTHPVATRLFAEALRRQAGDEAADRYLRTL